MRVVIVSFRINDEDLTLVNPTPLHITVAKNGIEDVEGGVVVEFKHIINYQPQSVLITGEELSVNGVINKIVKLSPDHLNAPKKMSL